MADFLTDEGAYQLLTGGINYASDTIKIRQVASSAAPSRTMTAMTGMTGVGTDQTLGSKTITKDTTNHRIVFDAADPTWTAVAAGSTIGYSIIYKDGVNDAARVPISVSQKTATPTNGGNITEQFDSNGCFRTQQ